MPKRSSKTQRDFHHTWYLQEWAAQANFKQADIARLAGWSKAVGSAIWNGQQYKQEIFDVVAPILNVRPYELLMPPEEAMAIRRLRETALQIVTDTPPKSSALHPVIALASPQEIKK